MALKINSVNSTLGYLMGRSVRPATRREDQLLRQRYSVSQSLHWKDLTGHYGCVNAIEFSNGLGQYIASGGDDRRVLLWDVEKALSDIGKPAVMKGEHNSNIFCVAFDIHNKTAFSGGNDEQVIVHDLTTGETKDVFSHDDAVYGLSPDPTNSNMFASSCDDGRVLIFDVRDSCADPFVLANYTSSMHSVMYNPVEPRLLATANAKEGVGLWDVRKPRSCLLRYGSGLVQQSCMSVRFNQRGNYIVALRRRLPPVLYDIANNQPVCEFDHSGYYNSCTMKSICFAGDNDQYVLSGSDEFNLYMWALPDDLSERSYINSAHMVLKGHRSIVNQVRFNTANHLIISSGVEKIIKVWSPFKLPEKQLKGQSSRERRVYSHEEYINLVLQDGSVMSHDYSHESTEEDPRMMAFFDSLVQRELDGWSSDDSMSSNEEALYSRIVQLSQSDIDSDDSLPDLGQNNDDDPAYSPFTIAFASVMASQAAEGNDSFPRLNRALENAERLYAELNDDQEVGPSSEDTPDQSQESENVEAQPNEGSTSHRDLTALIKRKKQELKESMKRRMKYPLAEIFASDSDENDNDDSDNSSVSSLNIVIGGSSKRSEKEKEKPPLKKPDDDQSAEKSKQAQIKLQRLKNLRKRIMNSDSDASDVEIHEKKLDSETLEASTSNPSKTEGEYEKVQFKKFKRRNTGSALKNKEIESKEALRSRASPDLGPFLQKAGTSTSIEVRKTSGEEESVLRTGKLSGDSFSHKGKHKSKSSHRHFHKDDKERRESKHSAVSEHSRTSDDSKTKYENHSSHHKYNRHYRDRDRKNDRRDGKSVESDRHIHIQFDKDHKDGNNSNDFHRYEHEERKHEHDHRDGKTDNSHRHVYEEKKHDHKDDRGTHVYEKKHDHKDGRGDNSHRHDYEVKKRDHKDGTSDNSHRHVHEKNHDHKDNRDDNFNRHDYERKKHHKDSRSGKHSKRHVQEERIHNQTDGKTDQKHRRRVKSDSFTALDFDEKRYKFYSEKTEYSHRYDNFDGDYRGRTDSKKECENSRKSRLGEPFEKKHNFSDSDDGYYKRQKNDHGKLYNELQGDDCIIEDTVLCDKKCSVLGGGSEKNDQGKELQLSSQYCKKCAKLNIDGERDFCCDKDTQSDGQDLKYCRCSFNSKSTRLTNETRRKSDKDSGISDSGTESDEEEESQKKMNRFRKVPTADDQEPSCSYKSKNNEAMTNNISDSRTGGNMKEASKIKHEIRENSDDSDANDYCMDVGEDKHDGGHKKRDSSSTEEDQLTWLEFKRFKNRLERARKKYTKEKHHRRDERRKSDDK